MQKIATTLGTKMYNTGQSGFERANSKKSGVSASDIIMNMGVNSIDTAVRSVAPRASYNASYYRRKNNIM